MDTAQADAAGLGKGAVMIQPVALTDSYRFSLRMARRASSNFYRSFWLLPAPKRRSMTALYAFARYTDDLGDCDAPIGVRRRWLHWWRQATARALLADDPKQRLSLPDDCPEVADRKADPRLLWHACHLLPAVADTARRSQLPAKHLLEIIDGVLADQQKTRFDTYEQLEHYCYLVASAVGICCLHIWEFEPPLPLAAAIDCGIAFQLTNILRDIQEDARRGRIYLPRQHWQEHGLYEDDLLELRQDNRLRCLIADEAARAAQLYKSGWRIWDHVHPDGKPMFSMMWRTYRCLLQHIESEPEAVLRCRTRLRFGQRLHLLSHHFFPPLFRRLPVPPREIA